MGGRGRGRREAFRSPVKAEETKLPTEASPDEKRPVRPTPGVHSQYRPLTEEACCFSASFAARLSMDRPNSAQPVCMLRKGDVGFFDYIKCAEKSPFPRSHHAYPHLGRTTPFFRRDR